jgi:hypothetical protein
MLPKLAVFLRESGPDSADDAAKAFEKLKETGIAGLDQGKQTAGRLKNIEDIAEGIQGKLADSAKVISPKEHKEFVKAFEKLSGQEDVKAEDLRSLDREITEVTNKSQGFREAIKSTLKEVSDVSDNDLNKELKEFDQLDLKGKAAYVKEVEAKLEKLQGFLNNLKGKVKLNPKGIEATFEELAEKNELFLKYHAILEKNKEFIGSDDIIAEFDLWFCLRPTIADQKQGMKDFEATQLKPRKEAVAKFGEFDRARQQKCPEFKKVGLTEKEAILMKMELEMDKEFHANLNNCNDVSEDTRILLRAEYDKPDRAIKSREGFIVMLQSYLKTEAALSANYEALPAKTRARLEKNFDKTYDTIIKPGMDSKGLKAQHRSKPKAFAQLTSDEKAILLKHVEDNKDKIDAENNLEENLQGAYDKKIEEAMNHKPHPVLSAKTGKEFKAWFRQQLLEDETPDKITAQDHIKNFEKTSEYAKRERQITEFEGLIQEKVASNKITPETRLALAKEFDGPDSGFRIRKAIIDGLRGNEITGKLGENATAVQQLRLKAAFEEANGKFENAYKLYEAVLLMNEGDEMAKKELQRLQKLMPGIATPKETSPDISPEEDQLLDMIIDEALNRSSVKEARDKTAIMEQMADLQVRADQINASPTSRDKLRLKDSRDKDIDERLQDHTDGKKMLTKEGTARKKQTINVERLEHATSSDSSLLDFKKFLTQAQGDQNRKLEGQDFVEFKSEQAGGHVTGEVAKNKADRLEAQTKAALGEIVGRMVAERTGGQLNPKMQVAIKAKLAKKDIGVKFQVYN